MNLNKKKVLFYVHFRKEAISGGKVRYIGAREVSKPKGMNINEFKVTHPIQLVQSNELDQQNHKKQGKKFFSFQQESRNQQVLY